MVGARKFLIAYNVYLNTPDVEIAKKIAKAVRFSGGGLRFVKAAGFLVRGNLCRCAALSLSFATCLPARCEGLRLRALPTFLS